ncbi:MAG TPA: DUF5808 domain-containing protein [Ktedonobacteraceae bacterium]|nr:DUF5808 domain-containing protein [Ktedonobacteraceae bacterium]
MKRKKKIGPLGMLLTTVGTSLVVAAILDQLRLPPEQRTWHGEVAGVPYDFRMPTMERLQATFWNKDTARVLVPHAFGVGWGINFYPLFYPGTRVDE